MEVKFIESHSFLGEHMSMIVDGEEHHLTMTNTISYEQNVVDILKEKYDYKMNVDDVKFEWDGTL